jgi:tRNA pseudouridine55 synthase
VPTSRPRRGRADGVEIRYYNIIYDLVDDVKAAMSGMLSPERRETFIGNAEILEVFNITKVGKVAGCRVTEGKVERGAGVRLMRDNVVSPRRQAEDAQALQGRSERSATAGQECGMAFENYDDIRGRRRDRMLPVVSRRTCATSPNFASATTPASRTIRRSTRCCARPKSPAISTMMMTRTRPVMAPGPKAKGKPEMGRRGKKKGRPVSGWLVLDKPWDFGSTEAVSKIKWLFKAEKAGHAGTLDPLASGMLPIALGDATKTVPYVMDGRKIYEFTVAWGEERNTDDLEGKVTASSDARPEKAAIEAILPAYTGVIEQVPPAFSAVKIAGERAYDMARDGEVVEIPAREVEIHRITLLGCPDADHAVFEVECGKGTYVRALARDFGRQLGCYGHISALRRTMVAPFAEQAMVPLADLVALEEIEDDAERLAALDAFLVPAGEALGMLPRIDVSEDQAHRIRMGNPIILRGRDAPVATDDACAFVRGQLLSIGEVAGGEFRPRRVFKA